MTRIALAVVLLSCGWALSSAIGAEEPADLPQKAEAPKVDAAKADAPAAESPLKGKLGERLKQLREKREANPATPNTKDAPKPGDAPKGAAAEGGFAEKLKQLRGKGGRGGAELDMTKFQEKTWKVGDVERDALIYAPPAKDSKGDSKADSKAKRPVVFVFHGHGGNKQHSAKRMAFHELWPEAVSIYPQGLPTPAPVIDEQGRMPGWQKHQGDMGDRDLAFFDAMLKTALADYNADENRVYACGHSNGGFFCYVLLPARHAQLAAIAPVAGSLNPRDAKDISPLPVFHVAGERDPLVRYEAQVRGIEHMKKVNGCDAEGKPSGEHCTTYTSKNGPPVVAYLHPGAHEVPRAALPMIAEFFQQNVRKPAAGQRAAAQ